MSDSVSAHYYARFNRKQQQKNNKKNQTHFVEHFCKIKDFQATDVWKFKHNSFCVHVLQKNLRCLALNETQTEGNDGTFNAVLILFI